MNVSESLQSRKKTGKKGRVEVRRTRRWKLLQYRKLEPCREGLAEMWTARQTAELLYKSWTGKEISTMTLPAFLCARAQMTVLFPDVRSVSR